MPRRRRQARPSLSPLALLNTLPIGDGVLFLPFFTTRDALHLRGVCREVRALVTNFAWDDRDGRSGLNSRPLTSQGIQCEHLVHVCDFQSASDSMDKIEPQAENTDSSISA